MTGPAIPADGPPADREARVGRQVRLARVGRGLARWLADGVRAALRALVLSGLLIAGLVPLLALALAVVLVADLVQGLADHGMQGPDPAANGGLLTVLIFASLLYVRPLARLTRTLADGWFGVRVPAPYLPVPDVGRLSFGGQLRARVRWLATDPATWRDLLWLPVSTVVGLVLVVLPAAMALYGVVFTILPMVGVPVANIPYAGALTAHDPLVGLGGIAVTVAGLWLAPRLLPGYALTARALLGPTRQAELSTRVEQLKVSRSQYIDAGSAELRRIERDLHDGAQARLVAIGMTLDAAEQQLESSPAAARSLLAEAKQSSVQALAELRDLVRGIHPPVLADRGLCAALRAAALDSPVPARVVAELPGRPPGPVESAAYFAVSELLANIAKHAGARTTWIDVRHASGLLRITVGDDGRGGAHPARGSGLRGIERRLAAFDGVLAVSSPDGGPTVVKLEIPCALSSPKTSSC